MGEASKDKTRRIYISRLLQYPWHYQGTLFYNDSETIPLLLPALPKVKRKAKELYPGIPLLGRIGMRYVRPKECIAYVTFFSPAPLVDWDTISDCGEADKSRTRALRRRKLLSMANSIKTQAPYNLSKLLGVRKVNRHWLLNTEALPAPDRTLYEMFLASNWPEDECEEG